MAMNTNNTKPNTNSTLITNVLEFRCFEYDRSTLQTSIIKESCLKTFYSLLVSYTSVLLALGGVGKT